MVLEKLEAIFLRVISILIYCFILGVLAVIICGLEITFLTSYYS